MQKEKPSFLRQIIYYGFPVFSLYLIIGFLIYKTQDVLLGIIAGYLLGLMHAVLGYYSIELSINKPIGAFFKYMLGGMMLRLVLLLVTFAILIKFSGINVISLLTSLFIFYLINLTLELKYINNRQKISKNPNG